MTRSSLLAEGSGEGYSGGITDLMTSLAVIFILLLAAYVTKTEVSQAKAVDKPATIPAQLDHQAQLHHLAVESEPTNPNVLSIVVPDTVLHFEFGKSRLSPAAEHFLADTMPQYAFMLCGAEGRNVESFVIEGHTDDLGDDLLNLKLSQERSFAVMVQGLGIIRESLPWAYDCFQRKLSANGRGKQDLLYDAEGQLDRAGSRRVVFKLHLRRT